MSKKAKLAVWISAAVVVAALIVTWLFMTDKILWRKGSLLEIYNAEDLTIESIVFNGRVDGVRYFGRLTEREDIDKFTKKILDLDWQPVRQTNRNGNDYDLDLLLSDITICFEEVDNFEIDFRPYNDYTIEVYIWGGYYPSYRDKNGIYIVDGGYDAEYLKDIFVSGKITGT